jgi:hypothetical protein
MPLDPAFVADCFYGPGAQLIDEILRVDPETHTVVCRMPVHEDLPLTRDQVAHPIRPPRHVNGALMVHATGILGFVHAYYVLGLRHAEGWVGYGGKIERARFVSLAGIPGDPLVLTCRAAQIRRGKERIFGKYEFEFHQGERLVYESAQVAMWVRVDPSAPGLEAPAGEPI